MVGCLSPLHDAFNMTTTTVKTIGTGGDYTTLQAWFNAAPADLTVADVIWRGEVKNQEFVSASTLLNLSGKTADATRYFELTTEAGASFTDHANKATNALRYDATLGAALRVTGSSAGAIRCSIPFTRVSKLMITNTSDTGSTLAALFTENSGRLRVDQCICESYNSGVTVEGGIYLHNAWSILSNSVVVQKSTNAAAKIAHLSDGAGAYNCTFVSLGTTLTIGVGTKYVAAILKNVYIGGATTPDGGGTSTKTNCYSDVTASGYTVAAMSTATFQNVTAGTHDLRLATGSSLIDAGATESTYAASDVIGTARPQGASYDVGAHEYAAADATAPTLTSPTGTQTGSTTASGTVSTDEGNGTLYYLASTNATETAATVKAASSQAVSGTGSQSVSFTGLTASTTYYAHYCHRDAAGNDSTVANSTSFTTAAAASTYAPSINKPRSGMGTHFYGAR